MKKRTLKTVTNPSLNRQTLSIERGAELADLAAAVVEAYCSQGPINPDKIITAKGIALCYDHYQDAFDGMIECVRGRFYIHCNLDRESFPDSPRARFTLSHELGHYFIDEHRNNLASGHVKPHPSFSDKCVADLLAEREADFFASRLLVPDGRFRESARRCRAGLVGIEIISKQFDVSLSCAAIRFVTAEVFPCVIMKWSSEGYSWKWCSKQFWNLGYRRTIYSVGAIPPDSATGKCLAAGPMSNVFETATTAASWFLGIAHGSIRNVILREEAISLGRFGCLTLLTLHSGAFPAEVLASRQCELGA